MKDKDMEKKKRINFNVPVHLIPVIRQECDEQGVTASYLLRKLIEEALENRLEKNGFHTVHHP
jgi:predicted DNA binding CopG/RHH family protein